MELEIQNLVELRSVLTEEKFELETKVRKIYENYAEQESILLQKINSMIHSKYESLTITIEMVQKRKIYSTCTHPLFVHGDQEVPTDMFKGKRLTLNFSSVDMSRAEKGVLKVFYRVNRIKAIRLHPCFDSYPLYMVKKRK